MEACEAAAGSLNHNKLPDGNHPNMLHSHTKYVINKICTVCQQGNLGSLGETTKKNPGWF